jgi:predicted metal-dependent peptidase
MARLNQRSRRDQLTEEQLLGAARRIASSVLPYIAKGLYRIRSRNIEDMTIAGAYPIAMTQGGVMIWNSKFWLARDPRMLAAAMMHELGHWLRRHGDRRGDRDPQEWNTACDAAMNDDLLPPLMHAFGREPELAKFIQSWVYPKSLGCPDGQIEEYYYAKMPRQPSKQGQGREQSDEHDDDEDECDGDTGHEPHPHGRRRVCCGSAAGNKHPQEGEIDAEIGHNNFAVEMIRRAVAEDIREYSGKHAGNVPAGWARWADEQLKPPRVRWQDQLPRSIRRTLSFRRGQGYYSFDLPSRRQSAYGTKPGSIVIPARVTPQFNLYVAVDTSGSMCPQTELVRCMSEVAGILKQIKGAKIYFCTVDVDVYNMRPIRTMHDALRDRLPGGGGTDFRKLFEHLCSLRQNRCDLLAVFTDGYASVPGEPPPFPTIWGLVGPHPNVPAPWGTVIQIEPAAEAA